MQFTQVPAAATTADPVAAPENVPRSNMLTVPRTVDNSDAPVTKLAVASTSPTATTVVDFYAAVEGPNGLQDFPAMANIKWRLMGSVTLEAGKVVMSSFQVLPGTVYARIASGQVAGSLVLVGFAP